MAMKTTITAIAAMFSLMMLITPVRASAEVGAFQPQGVTQVGYFEPVGYWHHYHPWACSNGYFRRHHWRMCH
jgi:hypothetical protein